MTGRPADRARSPLDSADRRPRSCAMPDTIASHLAERFASDARALRARATALAGAPRRPGGGPDAAACRRMAEACDRVQALFAGATDDDAVRALLPTLAGLVAGAPGDAERSVYAGAVSRATDALDGGEENDDGDDADGDDDPADDADDADVAPGGGAGR